MKNAFTLNKLSADFYKDFSKDAYPEIERKPSRPYVVMIIKIEGTRFALPLRTNIRHNCCYKFKNTGRNTRASTGINFTKAVVISDEKYIGEAVTIDNEEFAELKRKFYFLISQFKRYLSDFIRYREEGGDEFAARRFRFTTLRYFENEFLPRKKGKRL